MKNILVALLAAGDSGRFWPYEGKYNLNFAGKDLIVHQLLQLERTGFENIIIVVNEKNRLYFSKILLDFPLRNISLVQQTLNLGMAGAVLSIKDSVSGHPLLVLNQSDLVEDLLFNDFKRTLSTDPGGLIAGTDTGSYFPGGYLALDKGAIRKVVEKPDVHNLPGHTVKLVFDYFKNSDSLISVLESLKSEKDDLYEMALNRLVQNGEVFKFLPYKGFWGHLKYPWHILDISGYFLSRLKGQKIKKASIDKKATLIGDVFIEDEVTVMEGAKISGPAYIGRGTVIGNNAVVRESMVGEKCVIGFSTEVTRSFIGKNCWFHSNYIGDSAIGDNVGMGAGAVLANFKLTETTVNSFAGGKRINTERLKLGSMIGKNVRIGVNASLMPGVKVGKNSVVGAGVILQNDLPEGKFVSIGEVNYRITDNKSEINTRKRESILKKLKK